MATDKPHVTTERLREYIRQNDGRASYLDLSGRSFRGEDLSEMDLRGIILSGADLRGTVFFHTILDYADLSDADLSPLPQERTNSLPTNMKHASLKKSILKGANLTQVNLLGADLTEANLEDAVFLEATLNQSNLTRAVLNGADLYKTDLRFAIFSDTKLYKDSLRGKILQESGEEFQDAKYVYLALKKNFEEIGDYDAASWAYVKERTMEMLTYVYARRYYYAQEVSLKLQNNGGRKLPIIFKFKFKYIFKSIFSFLFFVFFGFGERPFQVSIFCLVSIFFFSILFYLFGGLEQETGAVCGYSDYLLHSIGSFTTIPYLTPITPLAKILTSLDAITGVTALAAFTSALSQRIGGR